MVSPSEFNVISLYATVENPAYETKPNDVLLIFCISPVANDVSEDGFDAAICKSGLPMPLFLDSPYKDIIADEIIAFEVNDEVLNNIKPWSNLEN